MQWAAAFAYGLCGFHGFHDVGFGGGYGVAGRVADHQLGEQRGGESAARSVRRPGLNPLAGKPLAGSVCRSQEIVGRVEMASSDYYV